MLFERDKAGLSQDEPNVIVCGGRDGSMRLSASDQVNPLEVLSQLPLPGIVIFVHGVNSDGEWFQAGEAGLCKGLNERLKRNDEHLAHHGIEAGHLTSVSYLPDLTEDGYLNPEKTSQGFIKDEAHYSPVIQFRWGYKASDADLQTYGKGIFLNEKNYWGGGPFANGCSSLPDLWGDGLNDQLFLWLHAQHLNPTPDRMVYACPHRGYYIVAALRLAKLIGEIRKKQADVPVTIVCHSQGNMVSIAAAFLGDKLGKVTDGMSRSANCVANNYVLCNPPYSLLKSNKTEGWTQLGHGRQIYNARVATLNNFFKIIKDQAKDAQSDEEVNYWIANEKHNFTVEADREQRKFGTEPYKNNYGRVTLYFNPHDQVISASPVQGIGWRGMNQAEIDATTKGVSGVFCQRVFAQGFYVGESPKTLAQYDFWKNHHIKDENNKPLQPGDKRFWYPASPPAKYSIRKGLDANEGLVPKILTVATAPIFSFFFLLKTIPINGLPLDDDDKGWITPLNAPPLPKPFLPQSVRFGAASEKFDEYIDAPGWHRNAAQTREANDPYAGENSLRADPLLPNSPPETDKARGNAETEKGLLYEHHAYLRMRAKREGLKPRIDENGKPRNQEDDLATASEDYKAWRNEKIKLILAETANGSATDHSTILTNPDHSEKALAYDIPVGVCHIAKEDLDDLRRMADWRYLDDLGRDNPIAKFSSYFELGLMEEKQVKDWVERHDETTVPNEGAMPKKIIDERSII